VVLWVGVGGVGGGAYIRRAYNRMDFFVYR